MYAPLSFSASGGSRTFNYYFKRFQSDGSFDIRLISCAKFADKDKAEAELSGFEHKLIFWGDPSKSMIQKIKNLESRYNPWNANANLISNSDVDEIIETAEQYKGNGYVPDIVILEWTPIVLLAEKIKSVFPDARLVASEHDVTFVGYERKRDYYKGIKKIFWKQKADWEKKKELSALCNCDLILPHNPDNLNLLIQEGYERKKLHWLSPFFNNMENCDRRTNFKDILFFGAMARSENYLSAIWFIENVVPLISDLDVRFVILGSNPPDNLKKYQSDRIVVTGFVESIVPYFESAACLVAPLVLGAGIKVKILEGLSSGVPVITNDIGIEGIPAKSGLEYIHASEPKDYESAVRSAVKGDLEPIGIAGKAFIKKNYDLFKSFDDYKEKIKLLCRNDNS